MPSGLCSGQLGLCSRPGTSIGEGAPEVGLQAPHNMSLYPPDSVPEKGGSALLTAGQGTHGKGVNVPLGGLPGQPGTGSWHGGSGQFELVCF